jgi:hypothetical protein
MDVHRPKWAGIDTGVTTDTGVIIDLNHTVMAGNGINRAGTHTPGLFPLAAYSRHMHYWMRIGGCNPNTRFLGVIGPFPMYGSGYLTGPTPRTSFRDDGQFSSHNHIPLL